MEAQRQPEHLDVEGGASNQPVRSITDPGLPPRHWFRCEPRWALMGTATALLLMVVLVLGFGETASPRSSVNSHITAFTPGLLTPSIQRRPLIMHRPTPVTLSSSTLMELDEKTEERRKGAETLLSASGPESSWGLPTLTKEDEEKGYLAAVAAGDFAPSTRALPTLTKEDEGKGYLAAVAAGDFGPATRPMFLTEEDPAAVGMTMFAMMDLDGNGVVSEAEFRRYLARFKYTEAASTRIFKALDADGDGEISVGEISELATFVDENSNTALGTGARFSDALLVEARRSKADKIFDIVDENGDGEISSAELRAYLMADGYTEIASDAVLHSLDSNDDGKLSRSELCDGFEKYSKMRQAVMELVKILVVSGRWSVADEQVAVRAPKADLVA